MSAQPCWVVLLAVGCWGLALGDGEAVEDGHYLFRPNNDTFHTDYTRAL